MLFRSFMDVDHHHQDCLRHALAVAEKACAQRGQRLTRLRRRVLELIWSSHEPVKAYDLLEKLREEHAGSAPPTVYRALDFLQAQGLVHRISSLNAYVGCGRADQNHLSQFMICHDCGTVAEMDDAEIRQLLAEKARNLGFHIEHETIEISGRCPSCSAHGK